MTLAAVRACRRNTMVCEPLNAKKMTIVSPVFPGAPHVTRFFCPLLSYYLFLSSFLFHVLMDQSDYSAHENYGATMELPARATDDEASVGGWHGEEGMEAMDW